MARLTWLQRLYWQNFSKPVEERRLMQYLIQHPIGSVLEIGIGDGQRLQNILRLCTLKPNVTQLRYAGVDPFESGASTSTHLKLKDVHRMLAEKNVKAHLIPGDASNALPRVAHSIMASDLIVIDSGYGQSSTVGAAIEQWLPRLAHEHSIVFARANHNDSLAIVKIDSLDILRKAA